MSLRLLLKRVRMACAMYFFLGAIGCFAITATRVSEINQFMADVKNNKIATDQIEFRAVLLKRGLSVRELASSQIKRLDDTVAQALKNVKKGMDVSRLPVDTNQELYKDIELFAQQINNWYSDSNFTVSSQQIKEVNDTYQKLQELLLKQRAEHDFRTYQDMLNKLADQFYAIKKEKLLFRLRAVK